ncbi:MAG: hypothetical protein JWP11_832 [Frankiales bacterium]|nr:hypothetical protein [Frankiales bacterium]
MPASPYRRARWASWGVTRLIALGLGVAAFSLHRGNVFFDTNYYARWAHGALTGSRVPYRDFPWEYPPGALPAMVGPAVLERALPGAFFGRSVDMMYGALWVGSMLVVDGAVMRFVLHREHGVVRPPATALWTYGPPLLGAVSWTRYDLLPAGAALLAIVAAGGGRPRRSGSYAGVGAILKLWPALLAPIQRTRRAALISVSGMTAIVLGAGAVSRVVTGSSGFGQVLHYQARRGLQVESVVALPLMWLNRLRLPGYATRYRFGAWEVVGGPAKTLATAVGGISLAGIVLVVLAHWAFMRERATPGHVALSALTLSLVMIATDKVLSPQYLLWLLAVLVAACLLDPESWRPYVPWALGLTALTQLVFPWLYADLLRRAWPGLIVLSLRDLVLLGLLVATTRRVVSELRKPPPVVTGFEPLHQDLAGAS